MFCNNCGKELNENQKFCDNCGSPVVTEESVVNTAEETAEKTESGAETDVNVEETTQEVSQGIKEAAADSAETANDVSAQASVQTSSEAVENVYQGAPQNSYTNPNTAPQYVSAYSTPGTAGAKSSKKLLAVLCSAVGLAVIAAIIVAVILNSDSYKYKKAMKLISAENYETAFEILYKLGDYEDAESYLPFHGKYIDISVGDDRYLKFEDGRYEEMIPGSDDDSYYEGNYTVDGYQSATLFEDGDDDDESETYSVYQNYIYESKDEDFVFDEGVEIVKGKIDATVSETMHISLSSLSFKMVWKYTFNDDGTFTYTDRNYSNGSSSSFFDEDEEGTYKIDGDIITLKFEDGDRKSFLILDGKIYRNVYVREY